VTIYCIVIEAYTCFWLVEIWIQCLFRKFGTIWNI